MKNLTTLSLITAAILGLNGCGGEGTADGTSSEIQLSSIKQLSTASQKHTKEEWLEIERLIQSLDKPVKFDTLVSKASTKNLELLSYVGIPKKSTDGNSDSMFDDLLIAHSSDAMFDDLLGLHISDIDTQIAEECKEDDNCKEEAYDSLESALLLDKEEAYTIAQEIRKEKEQPTTMDGLLKEFTCDAGLERRVQFYGVEDNFSSANGVEVAHPSAQLQSIPSITNYNNGIGLSNYDTTITNRQFAEEITNLPVGMTKGHFYIGMQNHGGNDKISIGNIDNNSTTLDLFSGTITSNNAGLNRTNQVYHAPLSDIVFTDGGNLKAYANTSGRFDVYVQDDTYVDFVAVATCSKPDPIKEVTRIVNKFECSEKETLVKILGGEIDNFSPTDDVNNPAHPSTSLENIALGYSAYSNVAHYDYEQYDHHFVDTLNLNLLSGQTLTKAEFNMGYKVIGTSLHSNDRVYLGDINGSAGNYVGADLYGTTPLNRITVFGYGHLIKEDLFTLTNNAGQVAGTVGTTMKNNGFLDAYVQDDTAVDFTQVNLCVTDNCSENAKNIELNLSQLASWTFKPADAIENNVFNGTQYEGVWDNTINWFDFNNSHSDEVLEIPFCACGDTIVNINNLKADNAATVTLDGTLVASQTAAGQASMRRDDMSGTHEDGTLTVAAGTNGGTNHVLRVDVHNLGSEFGVAVDGTLNFRGNLGKCE
ncbi:MAG TPA: hypothetical protein ENK95_00695 [Campylobacterales bacterium]|nr:hypothetical protein [Campylobacterales bacterium]